MPAISKSQRKKIQSQKEENASKKAELLQDKRDYLAQVSRLRKSDNMSLESGNVGEHRFHHQNTAPSSISQRKRKRFESSFESRLKSAEEYFAKKMRNMRDMIIPPVTHETHSVTLRPVSYNEPTPSSSQTMQSTSRENEASNPLSLPTMQLKHLKDLENELNQQQPSLNNTSGGIEHLLLRQFKIDTVVEKKGSEARPESDDKNETHHKGIR